MTDEFHNLMDEAEYLRSRQLQLFLRRIQRWSLWAIVITSITLICVGQGLAWSRGLSHERLRSAISTWHSLTDFTRAISGGDAAALMMLGIVLWSGGASIPGPTAFQAVALPTELPDRTAARLGVSPVTHL